MNGFKVFTSLAGTDLISFPPNSQPNAVRFLYWIHPTDPSVLPAPTLTDLSGNSVGTFSREIGSGKGLYISLVNYFNGQNEAGELVCGGNAALFHKVLVSYEATLPYALNDGAFSEQVQVGNALNGATFSENVSFTPIPGRPLIAISGIWITREATAGPTFGHLVGNTSPEVSANDGTFLIAGAPIAGKIVNYQAKPHLAAIPNLTNFMALRGGINFIADFSYYSTELAVLPNVPAINQPQFYLIGAASTEFPIMGQFYPPNDTAARNHGAERTSGFDEFSYLGDQQPSISSAPFVLTGTVVHATEAAHVAYLELFMRALRDAYHIEYRIQNAVYRLLLAQNVDSYFTRKSVQGKPWISELTVKLCVTSLEWQKVSGSGTLNYDTLI